VTYQCAEQTPLCLLLHCLLHFQQDSPTPPESACATASATPDSSANNSRSSSFAYPLDDAARAYQLPGPPAAARAADYMKVASAVRNVTASLGSVPKAATLPDSGSSTSGSSSVGSTAGSSVRSSVGTETAQHALRHSGASLATPVVRVDLKNAETDQVHHEQYQSHDHCCIATYAFCMVY
jgi:hypothetical protein